MTDLHLRKLERAWQQNPTDENAINYMTVLARNGCNDYAAWLRFLGGHWTLDAPTKEGVFQRATKDGDQVLPPIQIYCLPNGVLRAQRGMETGLSPVHVWFGYWWSEPTPELPKAGGEDTIA